MHYAAECKRSLIARRMHEFLAPRPLPSPASRSHPRSTPWPFLKSESTRPHSVVGGDQKMWIVYLIDVWLVWLWKVRMPVSAWAEGRAGAGCTCLPHLPTRKRNAVIEIKYLPAFPVPVGEPLVRSARWIGHWPKDTTLLSAPGSPSWIATPTAQCVPPVWGAVYAPRSGATQIRMYVAFLERGGQS